MASVTKASFTRMNEGTKRSKLVGVDIWPLEALGSTKDGDLVVSCVHRPSAITIHSVPLSDTVRNSLAYWWFVFSGEATEAQRALINEKHPDQPMWSIGALLHDLQGQLDKMDTVDQVGAWQAKIITFIDDDELKSQLVALPIDYFITTLDGSCVRVSPHTDQVRLWYACCEFLATILGKECGAKLTSDKSGDKDMAKVLRPCPLTMKDLGNYFKTLRKKATRVLTLHPSLQDPNGPAATKWDDALEGGDSKLGSESRVVSDQLDDLKSLPNKLAVQRCVTVLGNLIGKKIDRQFNVLLTKCTEGAGLTSILKKWWAKLTPVEQADVEDDVITWLQRVRAKYGTAADGEILSRLGNSMTAYVEQIRKEGAALDWAVFALQGSMELTCKEDEEFDALMESLLEFGKPGVIRGSSEQEAQLRAALAKSVAVASHPDRREDIAKAFESVVGAKGEGKKAVDDFLTSRAGNLPSSVDLGTGSVKVQNKDERVVLNVGFHISAGVKIKEVREFVEKLFDEEIDLEQHHLDRGWGMMRVPQSQATKLIGVESSRKLVSDSGKIEVEIRSKSAKDKDYYLTEGHWADLKGGKQKRKRKQQGWSFVE